MTAASCQFGSMNDTTLPVGMRATRAAASPAAWVYNVAQSSRVSASTNTVRCGEVSAAASSEPASVVCTHSPRRYASAARAMFWWARAITAIGLIIHAAHGHRVSKARRQMRVDRHLCDLAIRGLVGALHLQRCRPRLNSQAVGQFGREQYRGDLLVQLGDAHPEQILDQRENRAGVALQQPADGGESAAYVVLRSAQGHGGAVGLPVAAHG